MADRSAWWRTGTGIAAWVLLAVAASGVAWAAVGVVADEGDPRSPVAVPSSPPDGSPDTSTTPETSDSSETPDTTGSTGSPNTQDPTETTPSPTGALESRTLSSAGGTVAVECTGSETVRMLYATPASGWRIAVESRGPAEVEVEFVRGDSELRTRAGCDGGAVDADVETSD